MSQKDSLADAAKAARIVAVIDLVLATVCAANGNAYFVPFMVLSGIMWAYSVYIQSKADGLEGE